jgi:hypothetical protein
MDTTELLATINLLAEQLDHKPDDLHEVHFKVQEIIRELKATGMSVPDDLIRFEQELAERVEGSK